MKLHNSRQAFGSNCTQLFDPTVETAKTEDNAFRPSRRVRRAGSAPKARPKWAGRSCLGPPICFRETYDGTPFIAQALGKQSVGPHHVRNAMRRVRQGRAA
jgi:hypothetical protein